MAGFVSLAAPARWVNGTGTNDVSDPFDYELGDTLVVYIAEAEANTGITYSCSVTSHTGFTWATHGKNNDVGNCGTQWGEFYGPPSNQTGVTVTLVNPGSSHIRWGVLRIRGSTGGYMASAYTKDLTTAPYHETQNLFETVAIWMWADYNHINASGRTQYPSDASEVDYYRDSSYMTMGVSWRNFSPTTPPAGYFDHGITGFSGAHVALRLQAYYLASGVQQVNQAVESDLAQALTFLPATVSLDQPVESDLAQPVDHYRIKPVGQATSVETAQPVALSHTSKIILGQATETQLAQVVAAGRILPVAQVAETDEILGPITGAHLAEIGQSVETSDANPVTALGTTAIIQAVETDEANPVLALGPRAVVVGQVDETDAARLMDVGHGPPLPPPPPPPVPRYRLVRNDGIDDHPRPNHGLWRRVAFPRTLPMLLLSGDPLSNVPGTVRELRSEGTQYDLEGVTYVIGGTWYGDQGDWIAITLQAAGYTLELVGG